MSITNRTCLLVWTVTTLLLYAQNSLCFAAEAGSPTVSKESARPCVLLTNGNVIFGDAKQRGEWVLIRNGEGNESQLPRQNVACWASSIEDLYQYRADHRTTGDLNAMIRDAQWCLDFELKEQASELVATVLDIDPENKLAQLLDKRINHQSADPNDPAWSIPTVRTTSHQDSVGLAAVNLADLKSFAGQIQPMLANRCGSCHSSPSEYKWSLALPPHGARPSSRMTRDNLQQCVEMINAESPNESLLFVKAVSAHGGVAAPLDARDTKAIEALKYWIHSTATSIVARSHDTTNEPGISAAPGAVLPPPVLFPGMSTESTSPVQESMGQLANPPSTRAADMPEPASPSRGLSRLPQVTNPFDPELFNRKFHPPVPPPDTSTVSLPTPPVNQ